LLLFGLIVELLSYVGFIVFVAGANSGNLLRTVEVHNELHWYEILHLVSLQQ